MSQLIQPKQYCALFYWLAVTSLVHSNLVLATASRQQDLVRLVSTKTKDPLRPNNSLEDVSQFLQDNSRVIALKKAEVHSKITTRVATLAAYFEPVLLGRGLVMVIDTHKLLVATKLFSDTMKSVGQTQAAKDMEQNMAKLKAVYDVAPHKIRHSLYDLLEYEKSLGVHQPHAVLKDPSAAIGALWIRRSLSFQYHWYNLMVNQKKHHNITPIEAALKAYHEELEPYHAWPLRKLYNVAIRSTTPARQELLARIANFDPDHFGPNEESATIRDLRRLLATWRPLLMRWNEIYVNLELEDNRRV